MFSKTAFVFFMAVVSCSLAAPLTKARIEELLSFVQNVPLADPSPHLASVMVANVSVMTNPDHKKQGFVDSGSLVSFTDKVTGQQKDDVLNAALFGQLAAEYQYNREKQTDDWYRYYAMVMEQVGWVMQDFTFSEYQAGGGKFTMDAVVIDILMAAFSDGTDVPADIAVAKEVLGALKSMADSDNRIVLFEHNSYSDQAGNFQIMPCSQDDSGAVVMRVGGFHFKSTEDTTRFLFFEWDSETVDIYKSTQVVTLDEDVYGAVRSTIVSRLKDKAHTFVANIPIA